MTTQERTGWRDNSLSQRHRAYGFDCPAVDLDFPMIEYTRGEPIALIEYKAGLSYVVDLEKSTYCALAKLANGSSIPFVVALYHPERFAFKLLAGNYHARNKLTGSLLTEREYVTWLYCLRGLALPDAVARKLNTWKPARNGAA